MGEPNANFTVRLSEDLRSTLRDAAIRFGLKESDIARMLIARGSKDLKKHCIVLHDNASRKRTA